MTDLDTFIKTARQNWPLRAHVDEPDFEVLYLRYQQRYIDGQWYRPVLDISSVEAKQPGQGAFKTLIARIRVEYPELPIYVENVIELRFREGLVRLGFRQVGPSASPSFFWLPGPEPGGHK